MITRGKFLALLTTAMLLIGVFAPSVNAEFTSNTTQFSVGEAKPLTAVAAKDISAPQLEVTTSDGRGLEFVVNVDAGSLVVAEVEAGGKVYTQVNLPGWANSYAAGLPALPVEVTQVGAPMGAEVEVTVTMGEARVMKLSAPVLPGVTQVAEWGLPGEEENGPAMPEMVEVYKEDAAVYGGGVYPAALAEVSGDGMMRQQRVVGVSVYPVQYNAGTQELTVYETLTVTVRFTGGVTVESTGARGESEAYEDIFSKMLLNYKEARGYRAGGMVESLAVESEVEGMGVDDAGSWTPPDPGWRVKVREDGMYKLTYEELELAGFPVESLLDPGTLQMYNMGEEIAIGVELGGDATFDAGDYILFYGEAIESKYTLDNVYWLTYGQASGLRMTTKSGSISTSSTPTTFIDQLHLEQNKSYRSVMPGFTAGEHFVWGSFYAPSTPTWSTTFSLSIPSTSTGVITAGLLGVTSNPTITLDHHVVVRLNGIPIGDLWFDGNNYAILEATVPADVLKNSPEINTIEFYAPLDTGSSNDLIYVDWIDIDYVNDFIAVNDSLEFSYGVAGTWKYLVEGFSTDLLQTYDVTNPHTPVSVSDVSITGTGPYSAEFQDEVIGENSYWIGSTETLKTVTGIEVDEAASDLKSTVNSADYIIINHGDFASAAGVLRDHRASHGLTALAVDVQDVYDEFSYGIIDPVGIHDFLSYAYNNWAEEPPSYVALMGDGNYDPKDYLGNGNTSYIPPYLADVDPWIQETAADNRYVTISGGDLMPDMMLGRLAVNSAAEADAVVAKIIAYETTPPAGDWRQQVLAVTDNADSGGNYSFISDNLISCCIPSAYSVEKVYYLVTHFDGTSANTAIKHGYGAFIVNYIGHGFTKIWAGDPVLFQTTDIPLLTNDGEQPIVLAMTCMEGYFIHPKITDSSLSEVTTRSINKGAIASWSATGMGVASGHDYLNREFLDVLLNEGAATVGAATQAGKLNLFTIGAAQDLMDTYLLFGDPALRMPVSTTTITSDTPDPSDVGEAYTVSVKVEGNYGTPIGTVSISDGSGATCDATLDGNGEGSCGLTSTTPGNKTLTAMYSGDTYYHKSSDTETHTVFPKGAPLLVSPPHRTFTNDNDIMLVWKTVKNAAFYKLLVSKDSDFTTKVVRKKVYPVGTERELNYELPDFPDGRYFWKVKAFYADGTRSPWSEVWMFKVDTKPPAVPKLYRPPNNKLSADATPAFTVYAAAGAKYYHYQVATDPDFLNIVVESDNFAGERWVVPDESALDYGEYYWRAKSIDKATNESGWSDSRRIFITFQKLPRYGAATTDKTPTFEWVAVAGSENYKLTISTDMLDVVYEASDLTPLTYHTVPRTNKLAAGNYWWKMSVYIGDAWIDTPWSAFRILP